MATTTTTNTADGTPAAVETTEAPAAVPADITATDAEATPDDLAVDKKPGREYETTRSGADVVRVLDNATRHAITIPASTYEADKDKRYTRLASPAVDRSGAPIAPKFQAPKGR